MSLLILPRNRLLYYNDIQLCKICGAQLWGYTDKILCDYHYNQKLRKEKLEKLNGITLEKI